MPLEQLLLSDNASYHHKVFRNDRYCSHQKVYRLASEFQHSLFLKKLRMASRRAALLLLVFFIFAFAEVSTPFWHSDDMFIWYWFVIGQTGAANHSIWSHLDSGFKYFTRGANCLLHCSIYNVLISTALCCRRTMPLHVHVFPPKILCNGWDRHRRFYVRHY